MNEEINEFVGGVKAQIKSLFKDQDEMKQEINHIKDGQKETTKISTLLEMQIESNKRQDEKMEKFAETFILINENLTGLHDTTKNLVKHVEHLDNRVHNLEEQGKIDTNKIKKKIIYEYIPSSIVGLMFGLLLMYLAIHFGLNK